MARISAIVPNYNRAGLIGETLVNLLSQSRPPDELIVIDDGSTDRSAEVIAGFGKDVTLLRQANAGPAAARNRGLAAASGDFIQFFDSDDLCSLDKLDAQERALSDSDAPFAYGPWLQARFGSGVAEYADMPLQQRALPPSHPALTWYLRGWVTVFQTCLFRRTVLDRVGPFRQDLMLGEDSELLFRILAAGGEPVHVPGALVLYRLHAGHQISRGGIAEQRRVRDLAHYAGIVGAQLDEMRGIDPRDRFYWKLVEHDVSGALARMEGTVPPSPALSPLQRAEGAGIRLFRRCRAGLSRRLGKSPFASPYRPAPLTDHQREGLAAIGYTPVKVAARVLEGS